jgi:hypothetical protein
MQCTCCTPRGAFVQPSTAAVAAADSSSTAHKTLATVSEYVVVALICDNLNTNDACWNQSSVNGNVCVSRHDLSLSLLLHAAQQLLICI